MTGYTEGDDPNYTYGRLALDAYRDGKLLRAMRPELTATVTLEQPQYQASELMISAALNGFRLAEVPTTMRDRASHAGHTKKDGNLRYGVRFARAALHTWRRDRNL